MPSSPNTLEVLTSTPESCSSRIGRKARTPLTTPWKLISTTHSSSSTAPSATLCDVATPALLNTIPSGAGRPFRDLGGERHLGLAVADVQPARQHRPGEALRRCRPARPRPGRRSPPGTRARTAAGPSPVRSRTRHPRRRPCGRRWGPCASVGIRAARRSRIALTAPPMLARSSRTSRPRWSEITASSRRPPTMMIAVSIVSGRAPISGCTARPDVDERHQHRREALERGQPALGAGLAQARDLAHEARVQRRLPGDVVDVGVDR